MLIVHSPFLTITSYWTVNGLSDKEVRQNRKYVQQVAYLSDEGRSRLIPRYKFMSTSSNVRHHIPNNKPMQHDCVKATDSRPRGAVEKSWTKR